MLQKHQTDNCQRGQDLNNNDQSKKSLHSKHPKKINPLNYINSLTRRNDRQKIYRTQCSTTDQATINIFHCQKLFGVFWLHTSTIQNPHHICCRNAFYSKLTTQECVHILRHLRRRSFTGTDCPNRLIRNNNSSQLLIGQNI